MAIFQVGTFPTSAAQKPINFITEFALDTNLACTHRPTLARPTPTSIKAVVAMNPTPMDDALGPVFRSEANETEDLQKAIQDAVNAAYLDWPNEAGVRRVQHGIDPFFQNTTTTSRLLVC